MHVSFMEIIGRPCQETPFHFLLASDASYKL